MVNFIIPGFYENYNLNKQLLELLKIHPEMFYDNINISCIYGVFPFCFLVGGRIFNEYRHATLEEIETIVSTFNQNFKIPLRIICTNPVVQKENFKNRFVNLVLSYCENDLNEITINNQELEAYIRNTYPKYKIISSTTKCITNTDKFLEEINNDKYYMVCLDYNLNHNWKMLERIPKEQKDKCEFLCNAICAPACPNRKLHYDLNGYFSLSYGKRYSTPGCSISDGTVAVKTRNYSNNITPDELYNKYVPMGFSYFKIEGRTLPPLEVILNYSYYMVKPEYHDTFISLMLKDNQYFTNYKMTEQKI